MMARDPARRYGDASEAANALAGALGLAMPAIEPVAQAAVVLPRVGDRSPPRARQRAKRLRMIGGLVAGLVAIPVSRIAFRLQGGYFAIGTWVIAEVFRLSFANLSAVGGGAGTTLTALRGIDKASRESWTYWIALLCVVASITLVYLFLRSKRGLALLAIRDNPVAAESQGIAVGSMKLAVYAVAAFGAGLAGALYFVGNLRISPDAAFSVNWTAFAIFMVVIGGMGRIEGPLVGTLVFWLLSKFFSDFGSWYLMGLGLLAILTTIYFKQGLWGYVQQRWGWSLFPTQRRVVLTTGPSA